MPISADTVTLSIVPQPIPNLVPVIPVFQELRMTSEGIAFTPETTQSQEMNPNFGITDSILTGVTSSGEIAFELSDEESIQELFVGCLGEEWVSNVIHDGTALKAYTVEKQFPEIPSAGLTAYHRFIDSVVTTLSISAAVGEPVTGAANISAGELLQDTVIVPGATYTPAGDEPILLPHDIVVQIGTFTATACFSDITLSFDNQARQQLCLGTLGTKSNIRGRMNATISATLYYANDDVVTALVNQDFITANVQFLNSTDGVEYSFAYPRCKLTAAPVLAAGTDTDVTVSLEIQALYDELLGYTVEIIRQSTILVSATTPSGTTVLPTVIDFTGTITMDLGVTASLDVLVDTQPLQSTVYVVPAQVPLATFLTDYVIYLNGVLLDALASVNGDTVEILAVIPAATIDISNLSVS